MEFRTWSKAQMPQYLHGGKKPGKDSMSVRQQKSMKMTDHDDRQQSTSRAIIRASNNVIVRKGVSQHMHPK